MGGWRVGSGWRGGRRALAGLVLLVACVFGTWPAGAPTGRADHGATNSWRLIDVVSRETDGRGVRAGNVTIDAANASASGGSVSITTRWEEICPGKSTRFRYSWSFAGPVERVARGAEVTVNIGLDVIGEHICNGAFTDYTSMEVLGDNDGSSASYLPEVSRYRPPTTVFKGVAPAVGRLFPRAENNPSHVPGPRRVRANPDDNGHFAWFKVAMYTRAGFTYDAVYVYEADAAAAGTGTGTTSGAGAGPVAPLGGVLDVEAFCRGANAGFTGVEHRDGRWTCVGPTGGSPIDLDDVCRAQFGRTRPWARQLNPADPRAWACEEAASWTGDWTTDFGDMKLVQTGEQASGTYNWKGGVIEGTVSGRRFIGVWTQEPTRRPPNDYGLVEFTFGPDGQTFEGRWWYGTVRSGDGEPWNGRRK